MIDSTFSYLKKVSSLNIKRKHVEANCLQTYTYSQEPLSTYLGQILEASQLRILFSWLLLRNIAIWSTKSRIFYKFYKIFTWEWGYGVCWKRWYAPHNKEELEKHLKSRRFGKHWQIVNPNLIFSLKKLVNRKILRIDSGKLRYAYKFSKEGCAVMTKLMHNVSDALHKLKTQLNS